MASFSVQSTVPLRMQGIAVARSRPLCFRHIARPGIMPLTSNPLLVRGSAVKAFEESSGAIDRAFVGLGAALSQQSVGTTSFGLEHAPLQSLYDVSEGLETPIQLIYLLTLLAFLAAGAFLVVRQVLIRRELDEGAKGLGERIRTGEATCEDYYELGVVLTRKRLYTQATKNLEKAKKVWDGEETELAQVHNALGYCYLNMEKVEEAVQEFKKAVELQPGYVTAWNNLGDAYERTKSWRNALTAYQEALSYAPNNTIARQRCEYCQTRCERLNL